MSDRVIFKANEEQVRRLINAMQPLMFTAAHKNFTQLTETWVTQMKRGRFTGYRPGRTGRKLRIRTGALRNSVGGRVTGRTLRALKATVRVGGGRAGYVATQEFGATIKGNDWLTIPVGKALTPSGALRSRAKLQKVGVTKARGNSPGGKPIYTTGFGRTFITRSRRGNLVIIARKPGRGRKKGSRKAGTLLYVLKRAVTIPPRLGAKNHFLKVINAQVPKLRKDIMHVLKTGSVA